MSLNGENTIGCGKYDSPCKSLDYVINISQSGDTIQLIGDQFNSSCFDHCMIQPITKSLTIKGDGNSTSLCCNGTVFKGYKSPLLLYAENTPLTLSQVTIRSSHILTTNSNVTLLNCTFEDSVLLLMQERYYVYYLDDNVLPLSLLDDVQFGYSYWVRDESFREDFHEERLTCFLTSAVLHNVQWTPQRNDVPPGLNTLHQLGIQAICQDIYINVTSSSMADNPIFIVSVLNLDVNIFDTLFEGTAQGSAAQGGLQVNSFCFPKIHVEKTVFSHLKYNDLGFSHMAGLLKHPAAMMITISDSYFIKECRIVHTYHIDICDSVFISNFRGLIVKSNLDHGIVNSFKLRIRRSIFQSNQVVNDGAGFFTDLENIRVNIEKCVFISNNAGVSPSDIDLIITGVPVGTDLPSVHGYEKLSENSVKLDLQIFDTHENFRNESINLHIRGSGGAIYMSHAKNVLIEDCSFVNNTASYYGGAIYTGSNVVIFMKGTRFTTAIVSPTMVSGIMVKSHSHLSVTNCSFRLLTPFVKNVSIFYHSREGIKHSISIQNISISCPRNSRLTASNTTIDIKDLSSPIFSLKLSFNDVIYICETCPVGQYFYKGDT